MTSALRRRSRVATTAGGHVAYQRVERIGKVSIYVRGGSYSLYFRENGKSVRQLIDGNLATARATASSVNAALAERRPSPFTFRRTTPSDMVREYLDSTAHVQNLALRTRERYRAALTRFSEFCGERSVSTIDRFDVLEVERFVAWLRTCRRNRNGRPGGRRGAYKVGGIEFILSTCRTAFNWAARQRMLPAFTTNAFAQFGVDRLRATEEESPPQIFTPDEERRFFEACNAWQRPVFRTLATYGLRVGELSHLLVEDVDLKAGTLQVRSKPELGWRVKTRRQRILPLTPEMSALFRELVGRRRFGFLFQQPDFARGARAPAFQFANDRALLARAQQLIEERRQIEPAPSEFDLLRVQRRFAHSLGQLTEKRVRDEFMALTKAIGCPQYTRVHDLRHLFSSRAQELGLNPLLVQELLGHATLEMTRRYTHLGLDTKRAALTRMATEVENGKADAQKLGCGDY